MGSIHGFESASLSDVGDSRERLQVHNKNDGFVDKMVPWYDGFAGEVDRIGPHTFRLRGKAEYFEPDKKGKPGIITITGLQPPPFHSLEELVGSHGAGHDHALFAGSGHGQWSDVCGAHRGGANSPLGRSA